MEQKLSRGFFPFLQTSEKRNLFPPSSLNWMQFIASPKLIFHRLAGSMGHGRQCVSARLPWPRVLICGNWPGDMEPNQWKRRQGDRRENQFVIAEEKSQSKGGEEDVGKTSRRGKDRRQCVYQQTFGCCQLTARALGYQRQKTRLYKQAVKAGGERQTDRRKTRQGPGEKKKKNAI